MWFHKWVYISIHRVEIFPICPLHKYQISRPQQYHTHKLACNGIPAGIILVNDLSCLVVLSRTNGYDTDIGLEFVQCSNVPHRQNRFFITMVGNTIGYGGVSGCTVTTTGSDFTSA